MKNKKHHIWAVILMLGIAMIPLRTWLKQRVAATVQTLRGRKTVEDRIEQFGPVVQERLAPAFDRIGCTFPPDKITLVGIKQANRLEVWVSEPPILLKTYPVLGASGGPGPKLREGDRQVPEGLYRIESLNPNSRYHLALRINYPNAFDRQKAKQDGRTNPGSDIMIHGNSCSIGCLAMGDEAAEDLFVLAAETGIENIRIILTPIDFRNHELPEQLPAQLPDWAPDLYRTIRTELLKLTNKPQG